MMKSVKLQLLATLVATVVTIVAVLLPVATSSDDDIREAAIRYHLRNVQERDVFFVQVGTRDPAADFLVRFADVPWKVKAASLAGFRKSGHVVIDPQTGKDSMILKVGDIAWNSPWHVTVSYGYYVANMGAAGYRYRMAWQFGRWVVVAKESLWVS